MVQSPWAVRLTTVGISLSASVRGRELRCVCVCLLCSTSQGHVGRAVRVS